MTRSTIGSRPVRSAPVLVQHGPGHLRRWYAQTSRRVVTAHDVTDRGAADALVVQPGSTAPGRARGPPPMRREGPEKLTGAALYADDLVVPGAWYGATIRSTDAHARFARARPRSRVRLVERSWSSPRPTSPARTSSARSRRDQPILVPIGGEIQHHAEPLALLAAPDRATLRGRPPRHPATATERCRAVFDPLDVGARLRHVRRSRAARSTRPSAAADLVLEGEYRVGHQEQLYIENNAMIAVAARRTAASRSRARSSARTTSTRRSSAALGARRHAGPGRPGRDGWRVRRQGGVPLGHRAPRRAPGAQGAAAGADDLRPPRGHRGDHQAPPGDRPPPDRGDRATAGSLAQDIEVVMDGGAYCTLTPVVLSRGAHPRRRPVPRARTSASAPARRATNTPPNGAFRGFGAPQVEFAAETHLNRLAERSGISPLELRRRNVYRPGDTTPTGQVLRESVAGEEVLERAAEARRVRAAADADRARPRPAVRLRVHPGLAAADRAAPGSRAGIGLALAWHGAGFTGSGEVKLASVVSLELTADGRGPDPDRVDRDGAGDQDDLPAARRRRRSASRWTTSRSPRRTPPTCPDSGPTVASRTAMVVGGMLIKAAAAAAGRRGGRDRRRRSPTRTARTPAATGRIRIDERFEPYPDVSFDDDDLPRRRLPGLRLGGLRRARRRRPRHRRGARPGRRRRRRHRARSSIRCSPRARSRAARSRPSATPRSRRSSCATAATSTTGSRPTSSRPRSTRRGSRRSSSRRRSAACPHGAKGVGELPMDVGAPAVVAAIADATGAWIADLPASPERILAAVPGRPAVSPLPPGRVGAGPMTAYRFTVNATPLEVDVPGMRRLLDVLREELGPDRHEGGLRRGRVRRLHGPARRRAGGLVPRPGLPGRRRRHPDRRGARRRRRPTPGGPAAVPSADRRLPGRVPRCGPAAPSAGICTPGMLMAARAPTSTPAAAPTRTRSARRSPATCCRCTGYTQDRRGHRSPIAAGGLALVADACRSSRPSSSPRTAWPTGARRRGPRRPTRPAARSPAART